MGPEGTVTSQCEEKSADRGRLARAGGTTCVIVGHSDDGRKTRIRLPSGSRKTIPSTCRGVIGITAGGGRMDKPVLKAGNNFHKFRVKRNSWPANNPCPMLATWGQSRTHCSTPHRYSPRWSEE